MICIFMYMTQLGSLQKQEFLTDVAQNHLGNFNLLAGVF